VKSLSYSVKIRRNRGVLPSYIVASNGKIMSRSIDYIATNDDLAVTGAELEEQTKDKQPKVGESIKIFTVQTSKKRKISTSRAGRHWARYFWGEILILPRVLLQTKRPLKGLNERLNHQRNLWRTESNRTKPNWTDCGKKVQIQVYIIALRHTKLSIDEIRQEISQVRSNFNICQETWLSFADFLAHAGRHPSASKGVSESRASLTIINNLGMKI
jgi:hypothetical protein